MSNDYSRLLIERIKRTKLRFDRKMNGVVEGGVSAYSSRKDPARIDFADERRLDPPVTETWYGGRLQWSREFGNSNKGDAS